LIRKETARIRKKVDAISTKFRLIYQVTPNISLRIGLLILC